MTSHLAAAAAASPAAGAEGTAVATAGAAAAAAAAAETGRPGARGARAEARRRCACGWAGSSGAIRCGTDSGFWPPWPCTLPTWARTSGWRSTTTFEASAGGSGSHFSSCCSVPSRCRSSASAGLSTTSATRTAPRWLLPPPPQPDTAKANCW